MEYPETVSRTHVGLTLVIYGWYNSLCLVRLDPIDAGSR